MAKNTKDVVADQSAYKKEIEKPVSMPPARKANEPVFKDYASI